MAAVPGGNLDSVYTYLIEQEYFNVTDKYFRPYILQSSVPYVEIQRKIVYFDEQLLFKIFKIDYENINIEFAIDRVNRRKPGYILDHKVIHDSNLKLTLRKQAGSKIDDLSNLDIEFIKKLLRCCFNDIINNLPYADYNYDTEHMLLDSDNVYFLHCDDIIHGNIFNINDANIVYSKLNWLWNYMSESQFRKLWTAELS